MIVVYNLRKGWTVYRFPLGGLVFPQVISQYFPHPTPAMAAARSQHASSANR